MIFVEVLPARHRYDKRRLIGVEWHKYVIHFMRHDDIEARIEEASAWVRDNIREGQCMVHLMNSKQCLLIYVANDDDAMLFELASYLAPGDKRGKQCWD